MNTAITRPGANPMPWGEFLGLLSERGMEFSYPSYPSDFYAITCSCGTIRRFSLGSSTSYQAAWSTDHTCPHPRNSNAH